MTRRPPVAYLEFLKPFGPEISTLALAVREAVLGVAPDAIELVYDAYNAVATGYTFTGKLSGAFIHIAAYSRWVNLGFNRGSELPDPGGHLRGEGRWIRHIRIQDAADLEPAWVHALIRAAIDAAPRPTEPLKPSATVRRTTGAKRRPV